MNPLSNIIRKVADEHDAATFVVKKAVPDAVRLILEDVEANKLAVTETAHRRLTQTVTRRVRNADGVARRQGTFFGNLRHAYAIDVEERVIKETAELTRDEFFRVMEIRRDQIEADRTHLAVLEHAARELEVIWEANPDLTFGQAETLFVKRMRSRQPSRSRPPPTHPAPPGTH